MNRKITLMCVIAVLFGVFWINPCFAANNGNDRTGPGGFAAAFGDTIPCLIITSAGSKPAPTIWSVFSSYADLKTKSGTPTKVSLFPKLQLTNFLATNQLTWRSDILILAIA